MLTKDVHLSWVSLSPLAQFNRSGGEHITLGNEFEQSLAIDKFGGDEMTIIRLANFVDGENVWVIERQGCECLKAEATNPFLVTDVIEGTHPETLCSIH